MSERSGKFSRSIRASFRALVSLRDRYVRKMTGLAGYSGAGVSYPSYASSEFSHRNSLDSDEDLRQLVRAASRARQMETVRRSQSVVVGRIDEDSEFGGEVVVGSSLIFPRSSSHGVAVGMKKRGGLM